MKVSSASTDVSLLAVAPTETPMGEVSRDQPLAEPSEELTGPSESKGPPASRLKLTVKRAQVPQEELPTDDSSGRPRRTVKAPDAFAPAPVAVEKPKRGRGSRKKEANVVCVHCQRGHSPNTNIIVFCDGCNKAWHQKCHDPPIDAEVVRVKEAEWFCHQCKPVPPASPVTSQPAQAMKTARTVHPRLQQGPRLDVGANEFTADERRAYLSHLSHAELVELLVHVSSRNPAVPIFPRNLRDLPASEFPCPVSRTDATTTTASAATTAIQKPSILKKRTREASAAIEKSAEEEPATRPRKRSRTTSAPAKPQSVAPSKKRTRAASAAVEDSSDEDPATTARKRPRTTSAPTKPATAQAAASKSSKGSKNSKGPAKGSSTTSTKSSSKASAKDSGKSSTASNARSRTTSTSTRRQASAQPSVSTSTTTRTTRSQNRSLTPMPPPRTTRDTSAEEASEPETEQDDSDDEFEEVEDHRVLPRPGHGFSPPSPLFDPRLLQEPAESQTFSHALHGPAKMGKVTKKPSQVRGKSVKK